MIRQVLNTRRHTTAEHASTAVMLLWMAERICQLPVRVPGAQVDLLPTIMPAFMYPLIGIDSNTAEARNAEGRVLRRS